MRSVDRYPLLVAGVSGSGKSTVGLGWARRCGAAYIEGDLFHSDASVAKMRAGLALEDADRIAWLERLAADVKTRAGLPAPVLACSALKRSYRERLRDTIPGLHVVLLQISPDLAAERVGQRTGHYMPVTLVASQFATLELPVGEPHTMVLEGSRPVEELLDGIATWLATS